MELGYSLLVLIIFIFTAETYINYISEIKIYVLLKNKVIFKQISVNNAKTNNTLYNG
jgi:hypothetical protein